MTTTDDVKDEKISDTLGDTVAQLKELGVMCDEYPLEQVVLDIGLYWVGRFKFGARVFRQKEHYSVLNDRLVENKVLRFIKRVLTRR